MAAITGPRNGISYGWGLGESGWNTLNDASLRFLDRAGPHLSIKDRDLATPPGSPSNGDTYIVAASPTGAWASQAGKIAYWSTEGTPAWVFYTPRVGYLTYIEDEQVLSVYKSGGWSTGVAI